MPYEIEAAIIGALSALVGAGIGGFIAWKATSSTNRLQRLTFVDASLLRIAEIAIEYPYLDNDTFCADYPDISDKESKERYENFCVIVFNTMNVAFDVCKGEHSEGLIPLRPGPQNVVVGGPGCDRTRQEHDGSG